MKEREPFIKRDSPISLTESGIKFLEESGGEKFIIGNLPELSKKIDVENPKTAYDVQVFSRKILTGMQDDSRFNPLKEYLFQKGLELADLILVMGIYLRDKILEEKKWNVDDVDKYDPARKIVISNAKTN